MTFVSRIMSLVITLCSKVFMTWYCGVKMVLFQSVSLLHDRVVLEEAVVLYLDAHSAAASAPPVRVRALCGLGQCLRALSLHASPDPPTHWLVNDMVSR